MCCYFVVVVVVVVVVVCHGDSCITIITTVAVGSTLAYQSLQYGPS